MCIEPAEWVPTVVLYSGEHEVPDEIALPSRFCDQHKNGKDDVNLRFLVNTATWSQAVLSIMALRKPPPDFWRSKVQWTRSAGGIKIPRA